MVSPATVLRGQSQPLTVTEIVRRAAENDEQRRQNRLTLEYDQTIRTERLDEAGAVAKTRTVRVVHREGQALTYADDEKVPANHDGEAADAEHSLAAINLSRLAPRFECVLAGESRVRGRPCYLVDYSPLSRQPTGTREEQVLGSLSGRFWIDKSTFEILQGKGSLAAPVSVAVFASITRMDFSFHTQTLPNGEAGPADFSLDLIVRAPLYFYHQRQSNRLENWRPAAPPPDGSGLRTTPPAPPPRPSPPPRGPGR